MLKFYAKFTRAADLAVRCHNPVPARRAPPEGTGPRTLPSAPIGFRADGLAVLAAVMAAEAGLEENTALSWLTEFASAAQHE